MKILVVDDDAIVAVSCRRILELAGHRVQTESDAEGALEALRKHTFDLLLIDVKMPKQDGVFLLLEIKKILPEMPIIVMSGYPTPDTIADVMKAGATHFIAKPFKPDELKNLIGRMLQK